MADMTTMDAMELVRNHLEAAGEDQLREMVKLMAEGLMDAEAQAQCGAPYGAASPERVNQRNGYRSRRWDTRVGSIELVALNASDVVFVPEGLEALVRRSKTDQEGAGLTNVVAPGSDTATCPVRALKDWLELAGIGEGAIFRPVDRHGHIADKRLSSFAVAVIVKRSAKAAGIPVPQLSGHSLRAGFVTTAKTNGADDAAIMDQTGHKNVATVHGYHRRKKKWERPASAKLGL